MLKTPLGYSVSTSRFIHPEANKIVVIVSATGVVKDFYKYFAQYLYDNQISAVTFDYGGIGKSRPISLRNFGTSAHKWAINDLETVIDSVKQQFPKQELILIGHSIGGQLIGLTPSALTASKIMLVAAQSGYYKLWKRSERYKMLIAWKVLFPVFNKILGYIPTKKFTPMEDLPGGMAMEWRKWCLSSNYLFDYFDDSALFFNKIKVPVVSYSTDKDKFASRSAVDWLTEKFSSATVVRKHLNPLDFDVKSIGHFGFFQKRCSHSVWPELLSEIRQI